MMPGTPRKRACGHVRDGVAGLFAALGAALGALRRRRVERRWLLVEIGEAALWASACASPAATTRPARRHLAVAARPRPLPRLLHPRPAPVGWRWPEAGSGSWRQGCSAVGSASASQPCKPISAPGLPAGARAPAPASGPRPPTGSSAAAPPFASGFLACGAGVVHQDSVGRWAGPSSPLHRWAVASADGGSRLPLGGLSGRSAAWRAAGGRAARWRAGGCSRVVVDIRWAAGLGSPRGKRCPQILAGV
jgi:hypothetical protein